MKSRYRSILYALPSGVLSKIAGAALNFLAVPIALHVLGEKTYAAYMAILGFSAWLALGSGGIGNLTAMTVAGQVHQQQKMRKDLWQVVLSNVAGVASVGLLLIIPFYLFVSHLLINAPAAARNPLQIAACYSFIAVALTAMSAAFEGHYIGLLKSDYCNRVRLIGQLLALSMLIAIVPLLPNVVSITIAMTLGPLAASLWFMARGTYDCPPPTDLRYDFRTIFTLLFHGCAYLAVSLAVMFYCGGGLPLFALVFGKDQLATAGVMAKIVQLYFSLTAILVVPLAAAVKQAIASGDYRWTRKIILECTLVTIAGSAVAAATVILFGTRLIRLWTGVDLPALEQWILPLVVMIAVVGWYHFWIYICFAFEGAWPVAICGLAETTIVTTAYLLLKSYVAPAASLWIAALVMLAFSGTILPIRVIRKLRGLRV